MRCDKMLLSTVVLTLLHTGCVKPTEQATGIKKAPVNTTVYDEQPSSVTYDNIHTQQPIVYADPMTTESTDNIYSSGGDSTVITPTVTDSYQPQISSPAPRTPVATDRYQPSTPIDSGRGGNGEAYGAYGAYSGGYDDPYSAGGAYSGGYAPIDDPYSSGTSASSSNSRYSTDIPYGTTPSVPSYGNNSSGTHKNGIQLQVAALKDYYAAEEFRKNLSIDPKYGSYVKRGAINKVIITGIPTREEAKALATRQFPGAFIVGGFETGSSASSGVSYSSSSPSYSQPAVGTPNNGIGVQVGAFSSKAKAKAVAQERARGEYTAVVKTAKVRGRIMYKAILLGFASKTDARRAIESGRFGDAFIVIGIHP